MTKIEPTICYLRDGKGHPFVTIAIDYDAVNKRVSMGWAVTSPLDNIEKKVGRKIALRRLEETPFQSEDYCSIEELDDFTYKWIKHRASNKDERSAAVHWSYFIINSDRLLAKVIARMIEDSELEV